MTQYQAGRIVFAVAERWPSSVIVGACAEWVPRPPDGSLTPVLFTTTAIVSGAGFHSAASGLPHFDRFELNLWRVGWS